KRKVGAVLRFYQKLNRAGNPTLRFNQLPAKPLRALPGKTISHFLEWLYRDYFPRLEKANKKAGHKTRLFVVDAFEKAQPRPRLR
ncbi:hypothetical protein ACC811_37000, partial [Rhizobium ruizarguesonis]